MEHFYTGLELRLFNKRLYHEKNGNIEFRNRKYMRQRLTCSTWENLGLRENKPILCIQCVQRGRKGTPRNLSRFLSGFPWKEAESIIPWMHLCVALLRCCKLLPVPGLIRLSAQTSSFTLFKKILLHFKCYKYSSRIFLWGID